MTLPLCPARALHSADKPAQQRALHLYGRLQLCDLISELARLPRRALARVWLVLRVAPGGGRRARAHERGRRERVDGLRVEHLFAGYLLAGRGDVRT